METETSQELAQLIQNISLDLCSLNQAFFGGEDYHEQLSCLHRGFHTLKGIFGMEGLAALNSLATVLQDFFKLLQLHKVNLMPEAFALLNLSLEQLNTGLNPGEPENLGRIDKLEFISSELACLIAKHKIAGRTESEKAELFQTANIPKDMIAVLIEEEEARLEVNIDQGKGIYQLRVSYSLSNFDEKLKLLHTQVEAFCEVISLQPILADSPEEIAFKILLATNSCLEEITQSISVAIKEIGLLRVPIKNDEFCDEGVADGFE